MASHPIRKSLAAALCATLMTASASLALLPFAATAQTILKAADVHPPGYPTVVAVEAMGRKFEEATKGKYRLQMFPSSVLGGEKEMIEQAQVGALQFIRTSLGPVGSVVPDVNVFNMPFVFRDEAHMRKVIDGPIGQEILDKITASSSRLVALGFMDAGSRSLYTKTPVRGPDDLKGQKIRMMGNPLFVDTMNAMGGNGISMSFTEVFTALQTGVVDGAENNPPSLYTSNHYTTGTRYYSQTNHLIIPELFAMSKVSWDKLTPEEQGLLKTFAREAQLEQRGLWDKSVADYTEKLKAAGVEFIAVDTRPFFDATAPVREKYGAAFKDLMARIEAVK